MEATFRTRILNVDDDAGGLYSKTRLLQRAGHEVLEATTGARALELVSECRPDLVLLDVKLPDMSGIEVCGRIKNDPRLAGILVIQTSATYVASEDRVRGLVGGADAYLPAPFGPEELLAMVEAMMRVRRAEQARERLLGELAEERDKLKARNDRLQLMTRAAGLLLAAPADRSIVAELFGMMKGVLDLHAYLHYALGDDGFLHLSGHAGIDPALLADRQSIAVGEGISGAVAQKCEARVVLDIQAEGGAAGDVLRASGMDSYVCAPLYTGERLLGTLGFGRRGGTPFPENDLQVIFAICDFASTALDRLRAEDALRMADRRKDEFLAMLAHELRNPLAPISNSVHLLRSASTPEASRGPVYDMMARQVLHLTRLVDDLLDVSRITRGKVTLRREAVSMAKVLVDATDANAHLLQARGHKLLLDAPPEPVIVEGDRTRLTQIVGNLINNAAKFSDMAGEIQLALSVEEGEALVRVADRGIGIGPELLPHVFELFTQGERSLDRSAGGLGIGLSLVRRLAELHGGSVEARSPGPGEGSEFLVRLPLARSSSIEGPPDSDDSAVDAPPPLRCLVVDDNADAADSIALLLSLSGHDVKTVYAGSEALALARDYRPDLVLLDIGLPDMSGYEVARRLRAQPETRDARLLALTGYGQEQDRSNARSAGFDAHLVKPVDPESLVALVATARG